MGFGGFGGTFSDGDRDRAQLWKAGGRRLQARVSEPTSVLWPELLPRRGLLK